MRRNIYSDAVEDIEILQTVDGVEMNCSDVRQFWVSWENGELKIGRGSVKDVEIILNVKQDCPYDIENIGLSGGPYDAYWLFNKTTPIEPEQKQITTRGITKYTTINGCPLFRIISTIYNVSLIECMAFCAKLTNCNRVQFTSFDHSCTGMSSEASSKGLIPNYLSAM
ncbi:uncharacterized protein LOC134723027 [Mytilus trossulus]|uniref:uncharacterized protein LOC134723027 n=1 Tax=Mytilus trossulus TaxID=6551 RepID=UPI00300536F8